LKKMPGKSRKKGKYSIQNKKQAGAGRANPVIQQASTAKVPETTPVSSPPVSPRVVPDLPRVAPARPARGAAAMAKPSGMRYEFVGVELRTIAILAAVMLVLLFVLSRVIA
jgi:hypothetical protein